MRVAFIALTSVALFAAAACDSTPPLRPEKLASSAVVSQDGVVGEAVTTTPAVVVTTNSGKAVPGVDVTFAVTSGGGTVSAATVKTDQAGVANAGSWVLGQAAGPNTLVASVAGITENVTFTANALPAPPSQMLLMSTFVGDAQSGTPLPFQPVIELRDRFNNLATNASASVTVELASGTGQLTGTTTLSAVVGRVTFSNIAITGTGTFTLRFTAPNLAAVLSMPFQVTSLVECPAARRLELNHTLGQMTRYQASDPTSPTCLAYDNTRNQGQQYLLLFENLPLYGSYGTSVFSGTQSESVMQVRLRTASGVAGMSVASAAAVRAPAAPPRAVHMWDFGEGPIYEIEPELPPGGVAGPMLLRRSQLVDLNSAAVEPALGDTLVVRLEGIQRLQIPTGNQKVVIRHISNELIIAEDTRLSFLTRENGALNTPLTDAQMSAIATEFAAHAKAQSDRFFEGRFNSSVESAANGNRVVAVHTLMGSNGVWGYTYSTGNYFAWDYWVGTNGSTIGSNQHAQRVADNVFMHEIAHMRHAGLIQRGGLAWQDQFRGHRWAVEGFARFTERLPIAARLLGNPDPSRTSNLTLPFNTAFNNIFFRDDVPTYLNAGSPMFDGYAASSFVFDYFADQVAQQGRDWLQALREFLLAAGSPQTLDAAVQKYLPGVTFEELFTRARIALYTDDIGYTLPNWTQYLQFNLRASRPVGSATASDPRNAWVKVVPGTSTSIADIMAGAAVGYIIDGTAVSAVTANMMIELPSRPNAVFSITRIR